MAGRIGPLSAAEFDGPFGSVAIILARRVMRAHGGPLTLATREGRGPHSEPWFGLEPTTWEE